MNEINLGLGREQSQGSFCGAIPLSNDLHHPRPFIDKDTPMNIGWIKQYRKMLDWEWWTTPLTAHLFCTMIMLANHKDTKWRGQEIKRGQLLTGRKQLAVKSGLTEMQVRTSLNNLKNTGEINQQITTKFSIITICNYDIYQDRRSDEILDVNQQDNQQVTNKQPADSQQVTTSKNDKNGRMEECKESIIITPSWKTDYSIYLKECTEAFKLIMDDDVTIQEQAKFYPDVDIAKSIEKSFINFWSTEAGWKHKKKSRSKDIDWRMTFINAINMNKVYMPRQFVNRTPVVPASAPKPLSMYELKEKRDALMKRREAIYKQEDMAERAELTKKINEVNGMIARYGE